MAIIQAKRGKTTYVYEVISYRDKETGKIKTRWEIQGKLDNNGNLIPSKKKVSKLPTENQEEVKALAVLEQSTEIQDKKPKIIEAEIVDNFSTTRVNKYIFGTTKTEGIAFDSNENKGLYSPEGGAIDVSKNEVKRQGINVMVSLDFNELKQEGGITINYDRLNPFDRAVHNAVATLWEAGHKNGMENNEYLTPRVIFQLLSGNTGESKDISPEIRKAILRSIDKMSSIKIAIDNSEEAKKYGYKTVKYYGSLLMSERIERVKLHGNDVEDCIHIGRSPILYDYAKIKKQIGSIEIKMLNVPKFRNTPENIELKEYLFMRIMEIKNPKSRISEVIRYETLYKYLRIEAPTRNSLLIKYKKVRDRVKKLLDFWKSKKLIKDYNEEKEGKIIAKIIIIC